MHQGSAVIPDSSNIDYKVEVVSCGLEHEDNQSQLAQPLDDNKCMYIVTGGVRKGDKKLALAAGTKTVRNKKHQVLHDVEVKIYDPNDRAQKWWHASNDQALHSYFPYSDHVMVERDGKLMLMDHGASFNTKKGTFKKNKLMYNSANKHWTNEVTGNSILIDVSDPFTTKQTAYFGQSPGDKKI